MLRRLSPLLTILVLGAAAAAEDTTGGWQPGATVEGKGFAYQIFSKQGGGEAFARFKVSGSLPGWLTQRLMASTVGKSFEDIAAEAIGRPADVASSVGESGHYRNRRLR